MIEAPILLLVPLNSLCFGSTLKPGADTRIVLIKDHTYDYGSVDSFRGSRRHNLARNLCAAAQPTASVSANSPYRRNGFHHRARRDAGTFFLLRTGPNSPAGLMAAFLAIPCAFVAVPTWIGFVIQACLLKRR